MIQTFGVYIKGITPLLINRFHEDAAQEATSGSHSRKERLTPEEDAASWLYSNGHGPFFPAENIRQSIIAAASRHKIGRRAATTDVAAATYISPFEIPLAGEWHVDTRAIVIPATKGRVLRYRPMFDDWSLDFKLQRDLDLVNERLMRDIVTDAGRLVGVGDFRPARKGPYGRFHFAVDIPRHRIDVSTAAFNPIGISVHLLVRLYNLLFGIVGGQVLRGYDTD